MKGCLPGSRTLLYGNLRRGRPDDHGAAAWLGLKVWRVWKTNSARDMLILGGDADVGAAGGHDAVEKMPHSGRLAYKVLDSADERVNGFKTTGRATQA